MKKSVIYILSILIVILNCSKEDSNNTKKNTKIVNYQTEEINIIDQEQYERNVIDANFDLICNVDLSDEMIFKPTFCKFDSSGNIYTMDISSFLIHKFSFNKNTNKYSHSIFGKGEGLGPGEFTNPTDLQIYKDKIYIANPPTGAIEIYSTHGKYLKRIKPLEEIIPHRVAVINNNLILEPQNLTYENLFYVYSYSGDFIFKFGTLIDKTNKSTVYHSNHIFQINNDSFYYLPNYLGFIGLYNNNNFVFAKATIDGVKQPKLIKKNVMDGFLVIKVQKEFITADQYACNKSYLILRSVNKKEDKIFYDVYSVDKFNYLNTLENFPFANYFDIYENYLACIDEFTLRVYKYDF
ncbi:MAG: hypothetical protein R6V04_12660 [bacterium]